MHDKDQAHFDILSAMAMAEELKSRVDSTAEILSDDDGFSTGFRLGVLSVTDAVMFRLRLSGFDFSESEFSDFGPQIDD